MELELELQLRLELELDLQLQRVLVDSNAAVDGFPFELGVGSEPELSLSRPGDRQRPESAHKTTGQVRNDGLDWLACHRLR